MNKTLSLSLILCLFACLPAAGEGLQSLPMSHLLKLADQEKGIGARPAGSKQEGMAADYIDQTLQSFGLEVRRQPFNRQSDKRAIVSQNVFTTIAGQSEQSVIIGAHFDSTGVAQGSLGATDNASGVAVLLSVAQALSQRKDLPLSVTLVFFGSEEVGKLGSKHYVSTMSQQERKHIVGMLNLDTVAGGDILYIHSASAEPYQCEEGSRYQYQSLFRDVLLAFHHADPLQSLDFELHAESDAFAAGETGDWSDHQPFACQGIPIAYIEATNMSILGKAGKDGYSQVTHPDYWDCFSGQTQGSCDPDNEHKWGEIWHTQYDRLDVLQDSFPQRVSRQMDANVRLIVGTLTDIDSMAELSRGPVATAKKQ
jgi:hypothetical protein